MEDNTLKFVRFVSDVWAHYGKSEIDLEIRNDFRALKQERERMGESPPTPPFDTSRDDLLPHLAFWVSGRTRDGTLVMTHAVRLYDIGPMPLPEFIRQHIPRVFGEGEIAKEFPQMVFRIHGRVAYHGEAWVHSDYRGKNLGEGLGVLCQILAGHKWDPDYVFAVCPPKLQKKGFQIRLGYVHHVVDAVHWAEQPKGANENTWLVWNDRQDLQHLLNQPLSSYLLQS